MIMTKHAELDETWFHDSLVEDWHERCALIPAGWLTTHAFNGVARAYRQSSSLVAASVYAQVALRVLTTRQGRRRCHRGGGMRLAR